MKTHAPAFALLVLGVLPGCFAARPYIVAESRSPTVYVQPRPVYREVVVHDDPVYIVRHDRDRVVTRYEDDARVYDRQRDYDPRTTVGVIHHPSGPHGVVVVGRDDGHGPRGDGRGRGDSGHDNNGGRGDNNGNNGHGDNGHGDSGNSGHGDSGHGDSGHGDSGHGDNGNAGHGDSGHGDSGHGDNNGNNGHGSNGKGNGNARGHKR